MIQAYILLAISIVFEVFATSLLPATKGFTVRKPSIIAILCYIICFAAFGKREGDLILIDRDYKTDLERAEAE